MADWYYTRRGQQRGPVSFDELRELADAGKLRPADLVWREGMADWTAAESAPGLFGGSSRRRRAYDEDDWDADEDWLPPPERHGLSTGAWVAIIGGIVGVVLLAGTAAFLLVSRPGLRSELDVSDHVTAADPIDRLRPLCRCKIYSVQLEAGKTYTIDLQSGAFDAFLRLEDGRTGQNVAMDDDGGEGLNSRIIYRPTRTGPYRVVVTTFAPGEGGPFRVTLRQGTLPRLPR